MIKSMDRLTLITKKGASITDRSNGTLAVVDIEDSHSVTVQGFTINGGAQGIRVQHRKCVLPDWQHDSRSWKVWCKCIERFPRVS